MVTVDQPSTFYRSADPSSLWKSSRKRCEATESISISCGSFHGACCQGLPFRTCLSLSKSGKYYAPGSFIGRDRQRRRPLPWRCFGLSFERWPGFLMCGLIVRHLLSVSVIPITICSMRICASKTSLGKPTPSTKSGDSFNPGAVSGVSTNSKSLSPFNSSFVSVLGCFQSSSLGYGPRLQITPKIDHQASGHGDDPDSPHSPSTSSKTSLVPLAQLTVRL